MSTRDAASEILRIRGEYERRQHEVPADFYHWGQPANYFYHSQTARACIAALQREGLFPLNGLSAADIGCGAGNWLLEFAQWNGESLAGIDLGEDPIARARRRLPNADLHCGDARHLPWADSSFDLVSQFTVFTSILHNGVKREIAAEMRRVVKPEGAILWTDFRFDNPRNRNVRGIGASEIRELFPDCDVKLSSVTLAPPIARRVVPVSWILGLALESVPFLRTHYVATIRRRK